METVTRSTTRRPRPEDRLEDVVRAGAAVFARRGYRRTQMADVARQMGVSPGNLYNYVDSKDALFYLVLRRMLGERAGDQPVVLPVTGASVPVTAEWMAKRLDFVSDFPELERAFARRRPADPLLAAHTPAPGCAHGAADAGELFGTLGGGRWSST